MTAQVPSTSPARQAELDAEDGKLFTLARGAKARAASPQGAAVRDQDGRTYAAAAVSLPSLQLTALQAAVAIAVASGASGLEAALVISAGGVDQASLSAAREFSAPVVILTDDAGVVGDRILL